MVPFVLEISLRSPIILGHRMMLDSLIIGAARERYGDDSIKEVPLLRTADGLVHASQAFAGTPDVPMVRSATYIQSFIRVLSNNPDMTEMLVKQPPPSAMNHGSGPNSNIESVYVTHNIPKVYFLGVGDVDRIRSIMLTIVHIGSQAHKGNGEVEQAIVTEVDVDPAWFGIVGLYHGQRIVLRPVPSRLTHLLPNGTTGFETAETWRFPFFPGHPRAVVERCLVPPFTSGDYFDREAIRGFCVTTSERRQVATTSR